MIVNNCNFHTKQLNSPSLETINTLNALEAEDVVATFFINGIRVNKITGPILTRMEKEGHVVAHHTYDHVSIENKTKREYIWNQETLTNDHNLTANSKEFFESQVDRTTTGELPVSDIYKSHIA